MSQVSKQLDRLDLPTPDNCFMNLHRAFVLLKHSHLRGGDPQIFHFVSMPVISLRRDFWQTVESLTILLHGFHLLCSKDDRKPLVLENRLIHSHLEHAQPSSTLSSFILLLSNFTCLVVRMPSNRIVDILHSHHIRVQRFNIHRHTMFFVPSRRMEQLHSASNDRGVLQLLDQLHRHSIPERIHSIIFLLILLILLILNWKSKRVCKFRLDIGIPRSKGLRSERRLGLQLLG